MGTLFSEEARDVDQYTKQHTNQNADQSVIQHAQYMAPMDSPAITRADMENYMNAHLQVRNEELVRLQKELIRVQSSYDHLNQSHQELLNKNVVIAKPANLTSHISEVAIDKFVQGLIDDPNVNIHGVPDFIELAMYKRTAVTMLSGLEKILDNVSFELIGHSIKLVICEKSKDEKLEEPNEEI